MIACGGMTEHGISLANLVIAAVTLIGSWIVSALARKWTDREDVLNLKKDVQYLHDANREMKERVRELERGERADRDSTPT